MTDEVRDSRLVEQMTQHQAAVYGFIFSMLGNAADANDVLQNTYLIIWKKRNEFHGQGKFLTWACSFARLEVYSFRRKQTKFATNDDRFLDLVASKVEERLSDREDRLAALDSCMKALPDNQRELLKMRYFEAKSNDAIASIRKTSDKVIRVTMHRIRKALARCIRNKLAEAATT